MNIQPISPVISCQPIEQVNFGKKNKKIDKKEAPAPLDDTFNKADITEQKYNIACRIAAYYKTQYENLLKNGYCEA